MQMHEMLERDGERKIEREREGGGKEEWRKRETRVQSARTDA